MFCSSLVTWSRTFEIAVKAPSKSFFSTAARTSAAPGNDSAALIAAGSTAGGFLQPTTPTEAARTSPATRTLETLEDIARMERITCDSEGR